MMRSGIDQLVPIIIASDTAPIVSAASEVKISKMKVNINIKININININIRIIALHYR